MNNLKVFLGYTQNVAVVYYRFMAYAKYMREVKGVEVAYSKYNIYDTNIFPWQAHLQEPGVLRQLEVLLEGADVTVFGAFCNPMALALMQAAQEKYKKPILTEIDDYVFSLPGYNHASNVYQSGNTMEWIIKKQLEVSDGLIVSTETLKKQYSDLNKNIYVIPNGIDLDIWDNLKPNNNKKDKIRIGFSGSPNHTGDVRMIKEVVTTILDKYPNVEFLFWGCCPEFFPDYKRIILKQDFITVDKFPRGLSDYNFDIGIAPLKDNNFNRGKSNLRWLELSALKVPCVASPTPAYAESIVDGKTGFIADTKEQWVEKLSALIENEELRKTVGNNAYLDVRKNYSIKDIAKDYVKILKEVKANGQRKHTGRNKKSSARHKSN